MHKATARLADAGLATDVRNDTTCCYALQDKVWVHGPGQEPWKVYVVKADADTLTKQQDSTSFLACLGRENARALPHQLPLQIAALDQLNILRAHVDPATWKARHAVHQQRLEDLVGHYRESEQNKARRDLTEPQTQMINDLMSGRMDLR